MSTPTAWTDFGRRAVTVVLVVLSLLAVPAVASARFTSAQSATQTVGTDRMVTPSGVFGTYSCERGGSSESITVTVISFYDGGPADSWYSYRLSRGAVTVDTATTGSKLVRLSGSKSKDNQTTTWTVTIQTVLKNWTSGTYTRSISCPASGERDGLL